MKNGISVVGVDGNVVQGISDKLTEFVKNTGLRPDYVVLSESQAEWCAENIVGKKIKMKGQRILKLSGLSAIVV